MKDIERRSETMLHDSLQKIPLLLRADLVKKRQQHRRQQRKRCHHADKHTFFTFWQSVEMFYTGGNQC